MLRTYPIIAVRQMLKQSMGCICWPSAVRDVLVRHVCAPCHDDVAIVAVVDLIPMRAKNPLCHQPRLETEVRGK